MGLTDEQRAVVEAQIPEGGTLLCNAFAGTGKTHTLLHFAKARPREKTLYLAFNKSMATEAQRKFSDLPNVEARTIHSLAFKHVGWKFQKRLGNLTHFDVEEFARGLNLGDPYEETRALICHLNEFCASDYKTVHEYAEEAAQDDVDYVLLGDVMRSLWNGILKDADMRVPHNMYLKMFEISVGSLGYDNVLIDEAQDVSDVMISIAQKQDDARKIFVGDKYQQIYSWNGAVNALQKLSGAGETMFLTQSFRCPSNVTRFAEPYLRLQGSPRTIRGCSHVQDDLGEKAVLARSNAQLFYYAATKCKQQKIRYLGGFDGYEFDVMLDVASIAEDNLGDVKSPILRKFKDIESLAKYAEGVGDHNLKVRLNICEQMGPKKIRRAYRDMKMTQASQSDADVTISTTHKAKGAEFDDVELLPGFVELKELIAKAETSDETPEVDVEELNLLYVAITRSKHRIKIPETLVIDHETEEVIQNAFQDGKLNLTGQFEDDLKDAQDQCITLGM